MASFDHDTCELCGALDGKVFKMSEYQVGVTAPPFHPWCRCCTAPYYEDMAGIGERWVRNEDGTTGKVPADTTFKEWKRAYVLPQSGWDGIIGVKTSDGHTVAQLVDHFLDQARARSVKVDEAVDALQHPLHKTDVKYNERGEPSVQYIGRAATVAYNPDTDTIVTTWPTGKSKRRKYGG